MPLSCMQMVAVRAAPDTEDEMNTARYILKADGVETGYATASDACRDAESLLRRTRMWGDLLLVTRKGVRLSTNAAGAARLVERTGRGVRLTVTPAALGGRVVDVYPAS